MTEDGRSLVACELSESSIRLPFMEPVRRPSILLLGHEHDGVPVNWVERSEACVEIPIVGVEASLNVAVAGSLVPYRMAGMA
jgi:tRNA (guanosine-2'-O-)-methyltransferase